MISPLNKRNQDENKPKRDEHGWLLPGHHIGRKRGSKNPATVLRDRMIETVEKLDADPRYGGDYVLWFAKKWPEKFMALLGSLLPKQLRIESETKHVHVAVMDLPEADRVKILNECRDRVRELRGDDVIEAVDVKVLNEGKP